MEQKSEPTISQIQLKPTKSHSLLTLIIIISTLVFLSLFPSQPPEFVNQALVSKLWGLVRLLVIGIAVCYGLFSRRNTGIEPALDAKERYLSGFSQFDSVFDNGFEDLNGYDDGLIVDSWQWSPIFDKWENPRFEIQSTSDGEKISQRKNFDHRYFNGESRAVVSQEKCVLDRWGKPELVDDYKPLNLPLRSLRPKIAENSRAECERFYKKDMSQTQNYDCQHLNGRQTAVVARENCFLDNGGKPERLDEYKPLNLPVRSLKSKIMGNSSADSVEEIGTTLRSDRFCEKNDKIKKGAIRGLVPINLEKKFEEVVALDCPIPWNSRSSRIHAREKFKPPSHARILSEGVYEFDILRSKETRSGRNREGENAGNVGSSSLGDFEFEKLNSQSIPNTVKMRENRGVNEEDQNVDQRKSTAHLRALSGKEFVSMKAESESNQMKVRDEKKNAKSPPCLRPSSVGEFGNDEKKIESRTDHIEPRGKEGYAKSFSQSESFWSSIYSPINSVSPSPYKPPLSAISTDEQDQKVEDYKKKDSRFSSFSANTRQLSTGSSIETDLERKCGVTSKISNKSTREENRERTKLAAPNKSLPRGKSVRTIRTNKSPLIDRDKEENCSGPMDERFEKPKGLNLENVTLEESSNLCEYQNGAKQEFCVSNKAQTEKESPNSDEKADSAIADGEELGTDEVDKKADAFIAKFREQIRLQKIDSIKRKHR